MEFLDKILDGIDTKPSSVLSVFVIGITATFIIAASLIATGFLLKIVISGIFGL